MLSDRCAPLRMAGKICRLLSFEVVFSENCQPPSGVMEKKAHTKILSALKDSEILNFLKIKYDYPQIIRKITPPLLIPASCIWLAVVRCLICLTSVRSNLCKHGNVPT